MQRPLIEDRFVKGGFCFFSDFFAFPMHTNPLIMAAGKDPHIQCHKWQPNI